MAPAAESEPDLLHTLTEIGRARACATIATAPGHPDEEAARRHTADARSDAHRALLARLNHHP